MYKTCGMSYPGLCASAKSYIWKSVGVPTLLYATECIHLNSGNLRDFKSCQGTIIKQAMGLGKRRHHTNLLSALNIPSLEAVIKKNTLNFYKRIFKVESPLLELQSKLLSYYIKTGLTINGTLLHRIINYGYSPIEVMSKSEKIKVTNDLYDSNGIVHSLRFLIFNDNYIKPFSDEYMMVKLLTSSFILSSQF